MTILDYQIREVIKSPTLEERFPDRLSPEYRVGSPAKTKFIRLMRGIPLNLTGVLGGISLGGVGLNSFVSPKPYVDLEGFAACYILVGLGLAVGAGWDWYKKYNKVRIERSDELEELVMETEDIDEIDED